MARYIVGIDLGTTHTVVAYADLNALRHGAKSAPQLFAIEQLVAPGEVASRAMLPSVRYHPAQGEMAEHDRVLPWGGTGEGIIGELARELGSRVPGRLVTSAKSWLSHRAVDRTEPILPWGAHPEIAKISPVDASASYLGHVASAWNHKFADEPLHLQEIVLTVPASFDEDARALTLEAAVSAGLRGLRLIEEPQAACYHWISKHENDLGPQLEGIGLLLVCDVGGGTTDFTLIKVEPDGISAQPRLTRVAVGEHLMLGGDNMDLALAHIAEGRLKISGGKLGAANLSQLVQQCRLAKERLLSPTAPERATVTLVGAGSKLIGESRSIELTRAEVQQILVEGFYPNTAPDARPQKVRGGIVEFGLPYVADPAVTRHLAAFLERSGHLSDSASIDKGGLPNAILLNGGVFKSEILAQRLLDVVQQWAGKPVRRLQNEMPETAVALGAVAYGLSRHGTGLRIGAGSARSYFLMLSDDESAAGNGVCILPRGTEEGREVELQDRVFSLRLGQPVRFHIASSTGETSFRPGELADIDDKAFTQLPPIAVVLPKEAGVEEQPVHLAAVLTEVGTLQMNCIAQKDPARRWRLEFQLRGAGRSGFGMSSALHPRFEEAAERIERIYGARRHQVDPREVKSLRRDLDSILGERDGWDTALLRELFVAVWDGAKHRRRSADHERVWFNLAGFCLRPGLGFPLDDWRVQQLWSIYEQGVQYVQESQVWAEWWTLWRRVAGGLDRQAQELLLGEISGELRPPVKQTGRRRVVRKPAYDMIVRLAGALERIHFEHKIEIGEWLLERLRGQSESAQSWWAVGRLGARVPFYGSAGNVIPKAAATNWLERALAVDWKKSEPASFAATLLARMSGDRERDVDESLRGRVVEKLRVSAVSPSWIGMVEQVSELDEADERQVFGESLPPGLRLIH